MSPTLNKIRRSIAVVIGIDAYTNGVPSLRSAVNDAMRLQAALKQHHYNVELRINEQATLARLRRLFTVALPKHIGEQDRLLVYFAGHGVALDGDDGPAGYLLPHDAQSGDNVTFLAMHQLHEWLTVLPCHHMLLILDCCFAGAFRWSSTRHMGATPQPLYRERYERFLASPAWQVITSAAYDQQALDFVATYGQRSDDGRHSPFARALFAALEGAADRPMARGNGAESGDGVITATELYSYLRDCVELGSIDRGQLQTPGIWPLKKHRKGEYIFLVPGRTVDLPPAPELTVKNNPYRGLEPYEEQHKDLFFGRDEQITELMTAVISQPVTVVVGASGSGKSSLVKAGLLPKLRQAVDPSWQIIGSIRPGRTPRQALVGALPGETVSLAESMATWHTTAPDRHVLLVIDQLEELITLCRDEDEREQFLSELATALQAGDAQFHIVITVRSDFEPQFVASALQPWWMSSRFVVPPLTQDDLRSAILGPAATRVLYFEPDTLVDRIINEVVQTPGALPLLSFTLSELYIKYLQRRADNRALIEADYEQLGGVAGSLRTRATAEYEQLDGLSQVTMRRVLLRMVSLEGGELARRRVPRVELVYADEAENERVEQVIAQLTQARLIVPDQDVDGAPVVEPAHDALVRGWDLLWSWIRDQQDMLVLQERLTQATVDWVRNQRSAKYLWEDDPRLPLLEQERVSSTSWLNKTEREFVESSSAERRKNRRIRAGVIATALVVLSILAITAWIQRNAAVANETRAIAGEATAVAERNVALSRQLAAQALTHQDQLDLSLLLSIEAYRASKTFEARSSLLSGLFSQPQLRTFLRTQTSGASHVAFNPDGKLLVSGGCTNAVGMCNSAVILFWDIQTWQPSGTPLLGHTGALSGIAFSPDGTILATSSTKEIILWDSVTRKPIGSPLTAHGRHISDFAFDPSGRLLAVADLVSDTITLWDVMTQRSIGQLRTGLRYGVTSVVFSPDGTILAAGAADQSEAGGGGEIILWNVRTQQPVGAPLVGHGYGVYALAFDPSGTILASGSRDETVALWDIHELKMIGSPLTETNSPITSIVFSADSRVLAAGDEAGNVTLWYADQSQSMPQHLKIRNDGITNIAFSPDSHTLVAGSNSGTLLVWDITAVGVLGETRRSLTSLDKIAFNTDSSLLAAAGKNGTHVWSIPSREHIDIQLGDRKERIWDIAFSVDNQILIMVSEEHLALWDLKNHQATRIPIPHPEGRGRLLSLSPDGKLLAIKTIGSPLIIWDVASQQPVLERPSSDTEWLRGLIFSHDGKILAIDDGSQITLWNIAENRSAGQPILYQKYADRAHSFAFSADDTLLAVAGSYGGNREPIAGDTNLNTIVLWDISKDVPVARPLVDRITGFVTFSPSGQILAVANGSSLSLWDVSTGQALINSIRVPGNGITDVTFNTSGTLIAANNSDGTVFVWDMNPENWIKKACNIANRNLTENEWHQYIGDNALYRATCP